MEKEEIVNMEMIAELLGKYAARPVSVKGKRNLPHFRIRRDLTVLAFGGGQDSTCILYKIILDPAFRSKWVSETYSF